MIEINGQSVYNAIAMGKLYFYKKQDTFIKRKHTDNIEKEKKRFFDAVKLAKSQLEDLYNKALLEASDEGAEIFHIHQIMMDDADYQESILNIMCSQMVCAEYAVAKTSDIFSDNFKNMDDEYMQARSIDVIDISDRIIKILSKDEDTMEELSEPYIIVADDLTPSETVQLDKKNLSGIITFSGSVNSHTSILARTMNIPAIINAEQIDERYDGEVAIIDGFSGSLYITPDEYKIKDYKKRKETDDARTKKLEELKGKENITKSGKKISLYANIGRPDETTAVLLNDAEGIGLFRSEFIYLESNNFPTEDEQFFAYKSVLEKMGDKKVIIRTLDIGADKKIDYFNLPKEENPALGYRAIRLCLKDKDIFKTQLRALFRASIYGNLAIMFPMITSEREIHLIKDIINEVKSELSEEGTKYKDKIETGIMIETPAAAIICDILAKEVDFFSIGTNDLTQYTLAIDRQNSSVQNFCDSHHKAILRLIEYISKTARKNNIWVGICGELASDMTLTKTFIDFGIDELSVSPSLVLPLREHILSLD